MEKSHRFFNCRRFTSYTLPCPYHDDENLMLVRNWVLQSSSPGLTLGSEIEKAEQICLKCESYTPFEKK
jgi:hypothetical protein